ILDFKKATELFADPQFDGEPVKIYQPRADEPVVPEDEEPGEQVLVVHVDGGDDDVDAEDDVAPGFDGSDQRSRRRVRYVVDNVPVRVVAERVQYYGPDGKLITESLKDYTRKRVTAEYA